MHGRWIDATRDVLDAGLAGLEGRRRESTSLYEAATRRLRDLDLPLDLGFCLLEFATFTGPDGGEVEAALDEARALFATLGSPPLLALVDQARPVPEPETAPSRKPAAGRPERPVSQPG